MSVETAQGIVKARVSSDHAFRVGETVGLEFASDRLALFDCLSGKAIPSALYQEVRHG